MAKLTAIEQVVDWFKALMRWERRIAPPHAKRGRIYEKREKPLSGSAPTAFSKPIPTLYATVEKANGDRIHLGGRGPGR